MARIIYAYFCLTLFTQVHGFEERFSFSLFNSYDKLFSDYENILNKNKNLVDEEIRERKRPDYDPEHPCSATTKLNQLLITAYEARRDQLLRGEYFNQAKRSLIQATITGGLGAFFSYINPSYGVYGAVALIVPILDSLRAIQLSIVEYYTLDPKKDPLHQLQLEYVAKRRFMRIDGEYYIRTVFELMFNGANSISRVNMCLNIPTKMRSFDIDCLSRIDGLTLDPKIIFQLKTALMDQIRNPTQTKERLVLYFWGPPGVGKTKTAIDLVKALGAPVTRLSFDDIIQKFGTDGPGRFLEAIFNAGYINMPIIFDEIDKYRDGDMNWEQVSDLFSATVTEFYNHYIGRYFTFCGLTIAIGNKPIPPEKAFIKDRLLEIEFLPLTIEQKRTIVTPYLEKLKRGRTKQLSIDTYTTEERSELDNLIDSDTENKGVRELKRKLKLKVSEFVAKRIGVYDINTEKRKIDKIRNPKYLLGVFVLCNLRRFNFSRH